jgi:hypothetical protein
MNSNADAWKNGDGNAQVNHTVEMGSRAFAAYCSGYTSTIFHDIQFNICGVNH